MLVTRTPLIDLVPIERATMPNRVVTQYDKEDIEQLGLVKIDLLSLRTLGVVSDALDRIERDTGSRIDLDSLPHDDPEVFRSIQAADTVGMFQIESRAQMQALPKARPERFEDLVVQVAIIRPGPVQGNAVHPYLRRRAGEEEVTYAHESLRPILEDTLGVILYQEQVMQVAIEVCGYTAVEADIFRKAMGSHRSHAKMQAERPRFIGGAMRTGLTERAGRGALPEVLRLRRVRLRPRPRRRLRQDQLRHRLAEALLARALHRRRAEQSADGLLLARGGHQRREAPRHPCAADRRQRIGLGARHASLSADSSKPSRHTRQLPPVQPKPNERRLARAELHPSARGRGGAIAPSPLVSSGATPAERTEFAIRLGLRQVKGIDESARETLERERARGPYAGIRDFVARTGLGEQVVERLISIGAFDWTGSPRRELLWQLRTTLADADPAHPALGLTDDAQRALGASLPPMTDAEQVAADYRDTGVAPNLHAVELFRERLASRGVISVADAARLRDRSIIRLAGLAVSVQHPMTAKGFVFIALEDETGMINVTLRPKVYQAHRALLHRHPLLVIDGRLQVEGAVLNVVAQRLRSVDDTLDGPPERLDLAKQQRMFR